MLRASGATINETSGHGRQRAAGTLGAGQLPQEPCARQEP